jgi:UDP-glucose 6-dehydrogenase
MKIGLIGNGFVGSAIYENLKNDYKFVIYDRKPALSNRNSIGEVVKEAKIIFVALPTPMYNNGECDLAIIFDAMSEIYNHYNNNIIILKSTVVPGKDRSKSHRGFQELQSHDLWWTQRRYG